jgi:predicted HTH domain antitoxin
MTVQNETQLELACRMFDTGRLTLFKAAKLAGLSQGEFEDVLLDRHIPIYRYTEDDLKNDSQIFGHAEK